VLSAESRAGQHKYDDVERACAHLHGALDLLAKRPSLATRAEARRRGPLWRRVGPEGLPKQRAEPTAFWMWSLASTGASCPAAAITRPSSCPCFGLSAREDGERLHQLGLSISQPQAGADDRIDRPRSETVLRRQCGPRRVPPLTAASLGRSTQSTVLDTRQKQSARRIDARWSADAASQFAEHPADDPDVTKAGGWAKKRPPAPGRRAKAPERRGFVQAGCGVASWCKSSVERCDRRR
jgi:hypothetical protein